jgi:hypothetical protein
MTYAVVVQVVAEVADEQVTTLDPSVEQRIQEVEPEA